MTPPSTRTENGRPDLTVVIPVFNEVLTIREILRQVDRVPISKQIVVVDDGSLDGTGRVLSEVERGWIKEDHPHSTIEFLFQAENRGKGAAVRAGIARAEGRVTLIQDADLEYDPNDYGRLLTPILEGRADVVYGSRFIGSPRRVLYFWHSFGNRVLTTASNMLTDLNLTDMETCYKAFRTDIIQAIPLREDRFGFEPEVTAKLARLGLRIYEVPVAYHGRSYAEGKKIGWRDGVDALRVMLRFWLDDDVDESLVGRRTLEIMKKSGRYNRWVFEQIRPHLGNRVLEVGSGIGNISRLMLDKERLVLTDVDPEYRRSLRKEFGDFQNVGVTAFDLTSPPSDEILGERVDTVLCCNVLEHIENDGIALKHMRDCLSPGGRLVLLVPAQPLAFGSLDEALRHYRRYDSASLSKAITNLDLEIDRIFHLNGISLAAWAFNSRVQKRRVLPRAQVGLVDHLVPWLDFERRIGLPFGLSLLVVARLPSW